MREEIYLFYKNIFEPRFKYLKAYLSWILKQYKKKFKLEEAPVIPKTQLLLIGEERDLDNYRNEEVMLIGDEDLMNGSIDNLDRDIIYLLSGKYDDISLYLFKLRSLGFRVVLNEQCMEDNNKPIWKRRVSVIEAIYADLIIGDLDLSALDTSIRTEWIDFENQIFQNYLSKKEKYIETINFFLKSGWELNRLNTIASAILLEAISESHVCDTPVNVLIKESVKTAKNYCEDGEYKLINGLLENCLKNDSDTF